MEIQPRPPLDIKSSPESNEAVVNLIQASEPQMLTEVNPKLKSHQFPT